MSNRATRNEHPDEPDISPGSRSMQHFLSPLWDKHGDKLERQWLIACGMLAAPICLCFFAFVLCDIFRFTTLTSLRDPDEFLWLHVEVVFAFFICVQVSLVVTLIVVGIPSRIVMNLVVKDRRRRCWKETVVLFVTSGSLATMAYSLFVYPAGG